MKKKSIGVVIGRFETPYLHDGHQYLLSEVSKKHDTLCVVLGTHDGVPTNRYPLDLATREKMIHSLYPSAILLSIHDTPSHGAWSQSLDTKLQMKFKKSDITLYCSRDSFHDFYSGKYPVVVLSEIESPSATIIRSTECNVPLDTVDFRKGAIYNATTRHPVVYSTIDIAPYRNSNGGVEVLLGEKHCDGGKLRFIGGFMDPRDKSHAEAAVRELNEEVGGIIFGEPIYVGSEKIHDHRYLLSQDSVITTLFIIPARGDSPMPHDDLDGAKWVPLEMIDTLVAPLHQTLAVMVKESLRKKFLNN